MFKEFRNKKKIIDFFRQYNKATKKLYVLSQWEYVEVWINYIWMIIHIKFYDCKDKEEVARDLIITIEKWKKVLKEKKEEIFNKIVEEMKLQVDDELLSLLQYL